MEKAHPGVQDIFYQVFDKGMMKDGEGRDIDFKNTVIIMTTNAGTDLIKSLCSDPDTRPIPSAFVQGALSRVAQDVQAGVPRPGDDHSVLPAGRRRDAADHRAETRQVGRRIEEHYKATFTYTPELVDAIARRCTEVDTGARNVDHILTRTLLPEMSAQFLAAWPSGRQSAE